MEPLVKTPSRSGRSNMNSSIDESKMNDQVVKDCASGLYCLTALLRPNSRDAAMYLKAEVHT